MGWGGEGGVSMAAKATGSMTPRRWGNTDDDEEGLALLLLLPLVLAGGTVGVLLNEGDTLLPAPDTPCGVLVDDLGTEAMVVVLSASGEGISLM